MFLFLFFEAFLLSERVSPSKRALKRSVELVCGDYFSHANLIPVKNIPAKNKKVQCPSEEQEHPGEEHEGPLSKRRTRTSEIDAKGRTNVSGQEHLRGKSFRKFPAENICSENVLAENIFLPANQLIKARRARS